jgi:hypothetical protein
VANPLALGALLAPKAQGWERGGRCSCPEDRITASDVAAMAAGMRDQAWDIYRAFYAGDAAAMARARTWLYLRATDLAREELWEIPRGAELLRHLVDLVLLDALLGEVGGSVYAEPWVELSARGQRSAAGRGREDWRGISRWQWYRLWRGRYGRVQALVVREISSARAVLRGQLEG